MTYFNTSFFIIPLVPALMHKMYRHPEAFREWTADMREWLRRRLGSATRRGETVFDSAGYHARGESMTDSREWLLGEPMESSQALSMRSHRSKSESAGQMPLWETAKLSVEFCILWFLANYFVIACLKHTTVASSTILTSTSSIFTLIFGAMFGVEKFNVRKLIGVLASLAGIVLISSVDFSGKSSDDEHRGHFPQKTSKELALGNTLALFSAVMYGIYTVFMKKRIADESAVNMPVFRTGQSR